MRLQTLVQGYEKVYRFFKTAPAAENGEKSMKENI